MVLIRIANQNLGHSLAAANLLDEGLRMGSYDIWSVQEPYLLSKGGRVGGLSLQFGMTCPSTMSRTATRPSVRREVRAG